VPFQAMSPTATGAPAEGAVLDARFATVPAGGNVTHTYTFVVKVRVSTSWCGQVGGADCVLTCCPEHRDLVICSARPRRRSTGPAWRPPACRCARACRSCLEWLSVVFLNTPHMQSVRSTGVQLRIISRTEWALDTAVLVGTYASLGVLKTRVAWRNFLILAAGFAVFLGSVSAHRSMKDAQRRRKARAAEAALLKAE
jgi:hypothetical protein